MSLSVNTGAIGFKGLLNLNTNNHRTIIFSDADLPVSIIEKIVADLAECDTQVNFLRTFDIAPDAREESIKRIGLDRDREYVSIILMTNDPKSHHYALDFISALECWDFARIEYPMIGGNLPSDRITHLFSVINHADYDEQDQLSELFYEYLGQSDNYTVSIVTECGTLTIQDSKPWFQLAGQLQQFEKRILPGGEVAYTGNRVDGVFTIDGGILAIPQWPEGEKQAERFQSLGELLASDPLTMEIKEGVIENFWSKKNLSSKLFGDLFPKNKYQSVTEVGISFNRACSEFIHDWPAASNEGRPGVHIGIGGDPDPEADGDDDRTLVHVDLMSANCLVTVNGLPFLKTGI